MHLICRLNGTFTGLFFFVQRYQAKQRAPYLGCGGAEQMTKCAKAILAVTGVVILLGVGGVVLSRRQPADSPSRSSPTGRSQSGRLFSWFRKQPVRLGLGPVPGHEAEYRALFDNLVPAFNSAQSEVALYVEYVPDDINQQWDPATRAEFWDLWTDYACRHALDILLVPRQRVADLAVQGAIVPIDRFLVRGTLKREDFLPGMLDSVRFEGKHWGMPLTFTAFLLMLNKAILEPGSAGQVKPDMLPPQEARTAGTPPIYFPDTWEELEELVATWARGSVFGPHGAARFFFQWPCDTAWLWRTLALQEGAQVITEDGRVDMSHPGFLAAFERVRRWNEDVLITEHPNPYIAPSMFSIAAPPLRSDRWLARFMGFDDELDGEDFDEATAFLQPASVPRGVSDAVVRDGVDSAVWTYVVVIMNRSRDVENAAWRFCQWLAHSDLMASVLATPNYPMLPAVRTLIERPAFAEPLKKNTVRQRVLQDVGRYTVMPLTPGLRQVEWSIEKHFREAFRGKISIEDALTAIEVEGNLAIEAGASSQGTERVSDHGAIQVTTNACRGT